MKIPGYSVQRVIGKGGMATVYLAIQESLGRPVVLKIMDEVNAEKSEELVERFIAEGRIIASLRHPNIITIFDIGVAEKSLFISMEYVQGGDLKRRMELPISVDEALEFLSKIASALAEAHRHGIVHRDVKPANILFRDENTPLLTDFGIAKQVDLESDLTSTGIFLGSPNYVSPEQADGVKIDGRADIYSLGCIFYEMLTGKKPYTSDSIIDIVIQHKQAPVPELPEEYRDLQPLLNRMMAKSREQRVPDADSLIAEIARAQKDRKRRLREAGLIVDADETLRIEVRERRAKKVLAGVILLGLIMFSSLKYVEIRLKEPTVRLDRVPTSTVLNDGTTPIVALDPAQTGTPAAPQEPEAPAEQQDQESAAAGGPEAGDPQPDPAPEPLPVAQKQGPPPAEVVEALLWLGRQSLEEYKLTYPPKDNAYYYYQRLLQLDPGNHAAVRGMLEIAERYAVLAEQALARNEVQKAATYIDIGLRINPDNHALNSLRNLVDTHSTSLLSTIKGLFSGK
jgi:serine/threonine protein kinase